VLPLHGEIGVDPGGSWRGLLGGPPQKAVPARARKTKKEKGKNRPEGRPLQSGPAHAVGGCYLGTVYFIESGWL